MRKSRRILMLLLVGAMLAPSIACGGLLDFLGWGRKSRTGSPGATRSLRSGPNAAGYTATRAQKATYHAAGASRDGYDAGQAHRTGYQGQRSTRTGYGPMPSGGYR